MREVVVEQRPELEGQVVAPGARQVTRHVADVGLETPIFGGVGGAMLLLCFCDPYREWARVEPAPSPAASDRL